MVESSTSLVRPSKIGLGLLITTATVALCFHLLAPPSVRPLRRSRHWGGIEELSGTAQTHGRSPEPGIMPANQSPALLDNGKKPRFVIHCGPMKTGTSSLQKDLMWLIQGDLEKDGWHYIGGKDPMEHIPMSGDPEDFLTMFEKEAKELRKLNVNLIRSREQYSALFYLHPWMYERLRDMLREDWDVLIVAGYRPYFEWLPSYWFQGQRMPYTNPNKPEERHKNPWTKKDSDQLESIDAMFPGFFDWWKSHSRFTDAIVELAKPYFPVKVYDIHNPQGARTHFLCDIVGESDIPSACRKSRELDLHPPERVNESNLKEVQYDAIVLEAARREMIDMDMWDRVTVVDEITVRQEQELQRTILDFPFLCPDQEHLDEFWEMSRLMDLEYMPELHEQDPYRLSKLREQFLAVVKKKKFCQVDVDAILAESEWQDFFRKFA